MLLLLLLLSFLPIIIWAYVFSYIDGDRLNKSRLLVWIFAWIVAVVPIVFFEQIFSFFKLSHLLLIFSKFSLTWFWIFLLVFFLFIFFSSFFYLFFQKKSYKTVLPYLFGNFGVFLIFTIFSTSFLYLTDYFWFFSSFWLWESDLNFSWIALNSFRLVLFYYVFIALVEELSKHINFLGYSVKHIDTVQKWVLYSIFATLGFVLVENMLYLYNIYQVSWFTPEFFRVYLFRFVFSLMVHVLCSSLFAFYFSRAYIRIGNVFNFSYIKILFTGIALAVWLHAFFDISLTYWWSFMMIIYFLAGYFYLTGVFYRE